MNIDKLERWAEQDGFEVWRFLSWPDMGPDNKMVTATALAQKIDGEYYFDVGINACRDGDMGKKGEDGVYERLWVGDWVNDGKVDKENVRPSTAHEAYLWLKHCINHSTQSIYFPYLLLELHIEDGDSYAIFKIEK